ncbi:MAG: hypothetical protein AAGD25_06505 [Cyanobacteria bacterium P01_F01_bin.150]
MTNTTYRYLRYFRHTATLTAPAGWVTVAVKVRDRGNGYQDVFDDDGGFWCFRNEFHDEYLDEKCQAELTAVPSGEPYQHEIHNSKPAVKITWRPAIPGFGGLNRIALEEDGWFPLRIVQGERLPNGKMAVNWWHEGVRKTRVLKDGEYEVIWEGKSPDGNLRRKTASQER